LIHVDDMCPALFFWWCLFYLYCRAHTIENCFVRTR